MSTSDAPAVEYNPDALRPLFRPWEEPNQHRQPNPAGGPALIAPGRRRSKALLVPRLRAAVDIWRHSGYAGASDTTLELLLHWFYTAHDGGFQYHFAQREAIETIIYLYEVMGYRDLSAMYSSLFGDEADPAVLKGIRPDEDAWARYCCKIATGGGKTKVMSLAIVWSYFHRLFEPNSGLAQHFLVIAPNLIVFERLKDDFAGERIFSSDPLLPPQWQDQFDLQVILQDEPGGGTSRGALYLTNIHRLYEREKTTAKKDASPSWAGPDVKRARALKVGEALRARIAAHPNIMVLNDEAHHLHDQDSAWNEALVALDEQSHAAGNAGACAQLDFTATPKHNDGTLFRHIVCDFPLGEAVDAGIVKVPVVGRSDALKVRPGFDNAAQKYEVHLKLGYQQYTYAYQEWQATRKPILFVMTEDTQSANEIAAALDSDDYPLLKGRVINLHTRLKGRIKKVKQAGRDVPVFEVNETAISDDDLRIIREISRDLDKEDSPYRCVVSVLMLREGWDVRNVTTIVPLRPYKAESNILAEQTLGRGLRRMTPPGETLERVTVVEHQAFVKLYEQELADEGVVIGQTPLDKPRPQSVSIFVDPAKPTAALDIELPHISDSIQTVTTVDGLTFETVRDHFRARYTPLPILQPRSGSIVFEERSLFTDELIAALNIDRGLLQMGATAVSVFVRELEKVCQLQSAHATLAPLLQRFIEEVLFEKPVSLYDGSIDHRMSDTDVAEHIRATFTPLVRKLTHTRTQRQRQEASLPLSSWKPYQSTITPLKPCVPAEKTLFNLVPCDRDLEREFADFCDVADDVAAFAKNAGPQKLMIDYIGLNGRKALYVPDFFVRAPNGVHYLVEMKGQEDTAVPLKARAAVQWCQTASTKSRPWRYVFVPMAIFEAATDFSIEMLARACEPRLKGLLETLKTGQLELPLEATPEQVKQERTDRVLQEAGIADLPPTIRVYVEQAVNVLAYDRQKHYPQFGGAFQPLLIPFEQLAGELLQKYLGPYVPQDHQAQAAYFDPDLGNQTPPVRNVFGKNGRNLQKNLVHGANCNRIGTLLFCLEYPQRWRQEFGGVWRDVRRVFAAPQFAGLYPALDAMNQFRNKHVAHVDEPLTDGDAAEVAMKHWIAGLVQLYQVVHGPL